MHIYHHAYTHITVPRSHLIQNYGDRLTAQQCPSQPMFHPVHPCLSRHLPALICNDLNEFYVCIYFVCLFVCLCMYV